MSTLALSAFFAAYIESALARSVIEDERDEKHGYSLDVKYGPEDISPTLLSAMRADCAAFLLANGPEIGEKYENAGRDFWIARNDCGAGFWDESGEWSDYEAKRLISSSKAAGPIHLYIGEDEMIYAKSPMC